MFNAFKRAAFAILIAGIVLGANVVFPQDALAASERSSKSIKSAKSSEAPETKPESTPTLSPEERAQLEKTRVDAMKYGVEYLRNAQDANGGFSSKMGIGPTTIVILGLLASGLPEDDPTLARALDFLQTGVQEDGGIYSPGGRIAIYETCLALACFNDAKNRFKTDKYDAILKNGEAFVRAQQYGEETGTTPDDAYYGGLGYGGETRPDLSNTQFFVETLRELGADADDEAIQRALTFVSRCQNLESDDAATPLAATGTDGGFVYTCVGDGESPAGQETSGGLRSYGSMTYAGLKSLIYAGLTPDDPRVEAALGWLRDNYSTTENPGLGRRGLYYYYHTASKTLDVLGGETFVDALGKSHFWRAELVETLRDAQQVDGSWVNDNRAWQENDPVLVTGYALIVLKYCALQDKETR